MVFAENITSRNSSCLLLSCNCRLLSGSARNVRRSAPIVKGRSLSAGEKYASRCETYTAGTYWSSVIAVAGGGGHSDIITDGSCEIVTYTSVSVVMFGERASYT